MKRLALATFAIVFTFATAQDMPEKPKELDNLDFLVGKWSSNVDKENNTTFTNEWLLNGRYLKMSQEGTLMGMPSKGLMTLTYSAESKQWYSVWMDSWGGHPVVGKGDWKGDVLTTVTDEVEMMGAKMKIRMLLTKKSKDAFVLDVTYSPDGKAWESMINFTYTRAK